MQTSTYLNELDEISNDNNIGGNTKDDRKVKKLDSISVSDDKREKINNNNNDVLDNNNIIINNHKLNSPIIKPLNENKSANEKNENIPIDNIINKDCRNEQIGDNELKNDIEKNKGFINANHSNNIIKTNSTNNVQLSNSNLDNYTNRNFSGKHNKYMYKKSKLNISLILLFLFFIPIFY